LLSEFESVSDYAQPTSVPGCTAFTLPEHAAFFLTQSPNAGARSIDSDELIVILKRASASASGRCARLATTLP
jgi:hypothetical protein